MFYYNKYGFYIDFVDKTLTLGLLAILLCVWRVISGFLNRNDKADKEKAERYNKECELFKNIWKEELEKGDPYFNPNFSLDYSNFVLKGDPKSMVS